eukprot:447825-Alexandrium_andersonii.AAC.1
MLALQCGGLSGRGTDLAVLHTRAFLSAAKANGCSAALVFVDFISAFYTVARRFAMPGSSGAIDWRAVLTQFRMSEQDVAAVAWCHSASNAIGSAGA